MARSIISAESPIVIDPRLEEARRAFEEARVALEEARAYLLRTHGETARARSASS